MKIEEAIEWMEEAVQETTECFEQCSPSLQKELVMQKEVFELAISALRSMLEAGEPLSLEQLKQMDGKPVWCEDVERWAIASVSDAGKWKDVPFALFEKNGGRFEWNVEDRELSLYSYPPAHIDRSKWTAEWVPMTDDDGCVWLECSTCEYDLDSLEESHPFCPSCGRAMTEEAWAELERRLRG